MDFGDFIKNSNKDNSNNNFYEEGLVAKFASISESFYEFLDMQYGEDFTLSTEESRRILQAAMADFGHPELDMDLLNKSHNHYLIEGDLEGNPNYEIDCPDFSKYV